MGFCTQALASTHLSKWSAGGKATLSKQFADCKAGELRFKVGDEVRKRIDVEGVELFATVNHE